MTNQHPLPQRNSVVPLKIGKPFASIVLTACIAALSSIGMPAAQARQHCSTATTSHPRGFWSWRLIDGRKCWYEGKPGLSKSSLEWPARASLQPASDGELASAPTVRPSNPLDSQAWAPTDSETFEALWRARVESFSPLSGWMKP